jgi:hypothetical protein
MGTDGMAICPSKRVASASSVSFHLPKSSFEEHGLTHGLRNTLQGHEYRIGPLWRASVFKNDLKRTSAPLHSHSNSHVGCWNHQSYSRWRRGRGEDDVSSTTRNGSIRTSVRCDRVARTVGTPATTPNARWAKRGLQHVGLRRPGKA